MVSSPDPNSRGGKGSGTRSINTGTIVVFVDSNEVYRGDMGSECVLLGYVAHPGCGGIISFIG